jgi:hypothetical protein
MTETPKAAGMKLKVIKIISKKPPAKIKLWYSQNIPHENFVRMRRKKAEGALTLEDRELRSLEAK